MSVYDTLVSMLTRYSTLFENRWSCYLHLFGVVGNGYHWDRGELVGLDDVKVSNPPERILHELQDFTPVFHTWNPYRLLEDRIKFAKNFYRMISSPVVTKGMTESEYVEWYSSKEPVKVSLLKDGTTPGEYLRTTHSKEFSKVYNHPPLEELKSDWAEARQEWEDYLRSMGVWIY